MFRTIARISQRLARNQINNVVPVLRRNYPWRANELTSNNSSLVRYYSANSSDNAKFTENIDPLVYEEICSETLESLCEYFEEIVDQSPNLKGADVTYSDGVLKVALGSQYGTYVINRQTPNKQIWLSSPTSGPKRYDLVLKNGGYWVYKHDGVPLHKLLQEEISKIVKSKVDFKTCAHSLV